LLLQDTVKYTSATFTPGALQRPHIEALAACRGRHPHHNWYARRPKGTWVRCRTGSSGSPHASACTRALTACASQAMSPAPRTCCRSRPGRSARLLRALRHRHVGRRRQRRFRAARRRRRRRRDGRAQRLSLRRGCLGLALPVPHLRAQSHAGALSPRIRARSAACACRSCGCRGLSPSRFLLRPRRPHSAPAVAATSHVPGPMLARHMHKACAVAARPSTHGGRTPSLYCSESAGFLGHLAVPLSGGRTVSNGAAGSGAGAGAAGGAAGPSGGHAPAGGLGSGRAAGSACPPSPAPPPSMPPRGQGAG